MSRPNRAVNADAPVQRFYLACSVAARRLPWYVRPHLRCGDGRRRARLRSRLVLGSVIVRVAGDACMAEQVGRTRHASRSTWRRRGYALHAFFHSLVQHRRGGALARHLPFHCNLCVPCHRGAICHCVCNKLRRALSSCVHGLRSASRSYPSSAA